MSYTETAMMPCLDAYRIQAFSQVAERAGLDFDADYQTLWRAWGAARPKIYEAATDGEATEHLYRALLVEIGLREGDATVQQLARPFEDTEPF